MLISEKYRSLQKSLHQTHDSYGSIHKTHAPAIIAQLMNQHRIEELLDYGAGKLRLMKALHDGRMVDHPFKYRPYEPADARYSDSPEPAQLVVCHDVLEHIEPDCLDDVLDDIRRCTEWLFYFSIHCGPAGKVLADGRNAHLIQEPPEWWIPHLIRRWDVQLIQRDDRGFSGVLTAKVY